MMMLFLDFKKPAKKIDTYNHVDFPVNRYALNILPCVSRIVAFIVKNIDTIFFAYFIGKLDSSHVEI